MTNVQIDYKGKVALVTGAASGIGRATALKFAASGASLVLADLTEEAGEQLAQEIRKSGGKALFQRTDVSCMEDCEALVAAALSQFGRIDVAFNNAGIFGELRRTGAWGSAKWQAHLDVNLTGVFNCLSCELEAMKDKGGAIVNNSSIMGLAGGAGAAAYSAAKHGVIGLTKSAALEYGRHGIRINAVCPGFIATPMTPVGTAAAEKTVASAIRRTALGRLGIPDEIAEAVLWLCSDAASFVAGVALAVDGGFTAC